MNFRPHLPDNCPPEDAQSSSGTVYRMVTDKPSNQDFLSFRELKPQKSYPSDCIASGLSTYTDPEGVRRLQSRVPRFRKMKVAKANLDESHGKMKNTPSNLHISHHTWWLEKDSEPWLDFNLVNIEDES